MLTLLCIALFLHETVYFSSKGLVHFTDNIAPALGLHLNSNFRKVLHSLFLTAIISVLFRPYNVFFILFLLSLLSLVIASFPKRVPNHLAVAWFFLLTIFLDEFFKLSNKTETINLPYFFSNGVIQIFTAETFLFAAFHKINRSFLNPNSSCGSGLILHYLLQRRVHLSKAPKWVVPTGIYAVILLEFISPILLLMQPTVLYGIIIIAMLVLAFGFMGHVHFSVTILAGIVTFFYNFNLDFNGQLTTLIFIIFSIFLAFIAGNRLVYKYSYIALLNYIILTFIVINIVWQIVSKIPLKNITFSSYQSSPVLFLALISAYTLNAVAPYIGLKLDFSFAMFSNLRPDKWDHLIIRHPKKFLVPRYLTEMTFDCKEEHYNKVFYLLSELVPLPMYYYYSIGYLVEVRYYLDQLFDLNADIIFSARDIETGQTIVLSSQNSKILWWYERLSVFPYYIPGPDFPLCS